MYKAKFVHKINFGNHLEESQTAGVTPSSVGLAEPVKSRLGHHFLSRTPDKAAVWV